jgi:hypothetical protein
MSDTAAAATATSAQAVAAPARSWFWKDASGFSFHDLLDVINPLQHLPVIGTVYRWLTGDEPGNVARVVGDGLYGGPISAAASLFNVVTEDKQGHDLGEQVLTAVFGPGHDKGATAVAATNPATAPAATTNLVRNADGATDLTAANIWAKPAPLLVADAAPANPAPSKGPSPATLAVAGAATAPTMPPAKPDHAPMPLVASGQGQPKPLFGGIATPLPPSTAAAPSGPQGDPAKAFLARTAAMQRQAAGPKSTVQMTAPVPLVMPPGSLPQRQPTPAASPAAPVDISQKMLDALDKYMKLQQKKEATPAETPAAVDLTL